MTTQLTGVFTKVEGGNTYELYPTTKAKCIEGLNYFGPVTTDGDGSSYIANVDGIEELTVGMKVTIIPHVVSNSTTPTFNLNSLGAKYIRMPGTYNTATSANGPIDSWLSKGKPVTLTWNGEHWETDIHRPTAASISGAVDIANGGTGATDAATACANLGALTANDFTVSEDGVLTLNFL